MKGQPNNSMMINDFLNNSDSHCLIDVRTPAEFQQGHIPGAVNIPLFSNEEREQVGTSFKQDSPRDAFLLGLDLVGTKMATYIRQLDKVSTGNSIVCYCWRGGQRSQSMSWLFEKAGYVVQYIEGGYKAYRNYIRSAFESQKYPLIVLGGRTGCGKSEILRALESQGQQMIDLEELAHHKGSAFGAINEPDQPSIEHFENKLYYEINKLNHNDWIWVENESRLIGSVHIYEGFWNQLKEAPLIYIDFPVKERFDYILRTYGNYPIEDLKASFDRVKKRLGPNLYKNAIEALNDNDLPGATQIALDYYDKSYNYMLERNDAPEIKLINFDKMNFQENAKVLIQYLCENIDSVKSEQ